MPKIDALGSRHRETVLLQRQRSKARNQLRCRLLVPILSGADCGCVGDVTAAGGGESQCKYINLLKTRVALCVGLVSARSMGYMVYEVLMFMLLPLCFPRFEFLRIECQLASLYLKTDLLGL
ncbi:hypothetical protein HN51_050549 [Arachis hypogaea]